MKISGEQLRLEIIKFCERALPCEQKFVQEFEAGAFGEQVELTLVCPKEVAKELSKSAKKARVQALSGSLEQTYNQIINTTPADYVYFCGGEVAELKKNMPGLVLDYAKYFKPDILCFGVQAKQEGVCLRFAESVSAGRYAVLAILRKLVGKGLLGTTCTTVFSLEFLKSQKICFLEGENAVFEFNLKAFEEAFSACSVAAVLAGCNKLDDIMGPAKPEKLKKQLEFLVKFLPQAGKLCEQLGLLPIALGAAGAFFARAVPEVKEEMLGLLQEFLGWEEVGAALEAEDNEEGFINQFSQDIYVDAAEDLQEREGVFLSNIIRFHRAENHNRIAEAMLWLVRFVYNKNNKNMIGRRYLEGLLQGTLKEVRDMYDFVVEHNLREVIANESVGAAADAAAELLEEAQDDESLFKIFNLIGQLAYMEEDLLGAISAFRTATFSKVNSKYEISKGFLDVVRARCPLEHQVLKLFLEHEEWLRWWVDGEIEGLEKLLAEVKEQKDSAEKSLVLARFCLKLGNYDNAAQFYKKVISSPKNEAKYPIDEAIEELYRAGREDLVNLIAELDG